jgi:peptide/nickel transport system substrate-binding protein
MKNKKLAIVAAASALLVIASTTACSTGGSSTSASAPKAQTLTIGGLFANLTNGWDPYKQSYGNVEVPFFQAPYATLLNVTHQGKIIAGLATKWSYTSPLTFSMTLRPNLKFSDGTALNAPAVKANIQRVVDKAVTGPTTDQLSNVVSVSTSGSLTVNLTLSTHDTSLPLDFTENMGAMVNPKALKDPAALAITPAGAGPYVMEKSATTAGSVWTFVRNKYYYDPSAYPYSTIVYKAITDQTASFNALRSGQVNITRISSLQLTAAKSAGITTLQWPSAINGLWLDDRTGSMVPALGDVRVRQAINYALDKQAIIKVNGGGTPESSMFWKSSQAYLKSASDKYSYNPAKAKALLAAAGYSSGLKLTFLSNPFFDNVNQVVEANLKAVGIDAVINDQNASYITDLPKASMVYFFWFPQGAYYDAKRLLLPDGGYNYLHTNDPKVVALFKAATSAKTDAEATKDWQAVNKYVVDQAWFAPVFDDGSQYFASDSKTHVAYNPGNDWPFLRDITPAS